jgi:tetratricopeptide (TPR) repeat protein
MLQFLAALVAIIALVNKLLESGWQPKRKDWPLLIPVLATVGGYVLVDKYLPPDPGGIWRHWVFVITCGTGLIVGGSLWWVMLRISLKDGSGPPRPRKRLKSPTFLVGLFHKIFPRESRVRLWASIPMVVAGTVLVAFGLNWQPVLPCDRLAVAIASFVTQDASLKDNAGNIRSRLRANLEPYTEVLLVRDRDWVIGNPQAPDQIRDREAAVWFGRVEAAHLVIWGEVMRCEGGKKIQVEWKIALANQWRTEPPASEAPADPNGVAPYIPDLSNLIAECTDSLKLDEQIDDVARLLTGFAYYKAEKVEEAIGFFSAGNPNQEALLWTGFSYHQMARKKMAKKDHNSDDIVTGLNKALEIYKTLDRENAGENELPAAVAHFLCGDAYQELPANSLDERRNNLLDAVTEYDNSQRTYKSLSREDPSTPWQLQNNLGVALYQVSGSGVEDPMKYLRRAESEYDTGLGLLGQKSETTTAQGSCTAAPVETPGDQKIEGVVMLSINRGSVRGKFGQLLKEKSEADKQSGRIVEAARENAEARDKLECAESDLSRALALLKGQRGRTRDPLREAKVAKNFANAQADLANMTEGPLRDELRGKAIIGYKEVLRVYDRGSLEYAMAEKQLAETYCDQGDESNDVASFQNAKDAYEDANRILEREEATLVLADARRYLGNTLVKLFDRGSGNLNDLDKAIDLLNLSLHFYKDNGRSQMNQVQAELNRACQTYPQDAAHPLPTACHQ